MLELNIFDLLKNWGLHYYHLLSSDFYREIQAQEALQNGQLGSGEGIPDLQPGVLASQAMIEKTLTEDPRWQGEKPPLP